ncbi:hypothetical protein [Gloeocapsopsis sp. IPPAS B-1203]|uniref:hypothetical protein n=1 Tax=Gloeocapsopsis sp. IPPAS B-1203 TaxID=2049454 RepID=UPI000C19BE90|nr:hypothetical protein [Gloeocapsopsis sp. IPPAS B-1203]PIG90822.1 hypothetical protein CSQ79_24555 [Gloeocapsopsis sp. IPPAS B-1203]
MNYSNVSFWQKVYEQSFGDRTLQAYSKTHIPLPNFSINYRFNHKTIAIKTTSFNAKSTWRRGVYVYQVLSVGSLRSLVGKIHSTLLGKTNLLVFDEDSSDYYIEISIPKWFLDITVEIWVLKEFSPESLLLSTQLGLPEKTLFLTLL